MSWSRNEEGTSDNRTVQDKLLEIVVAQHANVGTATNIVQQFIPSDIGDMQIGYR